MLDQHRLATFRVFGLFLQRILHIGPGLSISLRIGELLGGLQKQDIYRVLILFPLSNRYCQSIEEWSLFQHCYAPICMHLVTIYIDFTGEFQARGVTLHTVER